MKFLAPLAVIGLLVLLIFGAKWLILYGFILISIPDPEPYFQS